MACTVVSMPTNAQHASSSWRMQWHTIPALTYPTTRKALKKPTSSGYEGDSISPSTTATEASSHVVVGS